MFISIRYKLFITLLISVALVVVGMFLLLYWSFDRGFLNYLNTIEAKRLESLTTHLQEAYNDQGNWQFLRNNPRLWRQFLAASTPEGPQSFKPLYDSPRDDNSRGRHFGRNEGMGPGHMAGRALPPEAVEHLFEFRVVLLDQDRDVVAGLRQFPADLQLTTLTNGAATIGYLGHHAEQNLLSRQQLNFVEQQRKSFGAISLVIAALATLLSFPLAGRLVKRINALARGTHHLAAGKYDTTLEVGPRDELGQLTHDFNALALTLTKNEALRKQWVADISHELRTPLAVLRGEIEALQDGVRQATPEAVNSLHAEVLRLNRLVDDLFQLSLSDIGALTYRKEPVDLAAILTRTAGLFRAEFAARRIELLVDLPPATEIPLFGDGERLQQLFDNLLTNSLKYTDPGGKLRLSCRLAADSVEIVFQDSSPSVPPADISKLFDRLYRVDSSRNRASGGAGLGLAICKNIVEAHGGAISAAPSPLGGLLISIKFPAGVQQ